MKEGDYLREARLIALEFMATHIYNVMTKIVGADEGQIAGAERDALKGLASNPVAGASRLTPVQKDHLSSETTQAVERLFEMARANRVGST